MCALELAYELVTIPVEANRGGGSGDVMWRAVRIAAVMAAVLTSANAARADTIINLDISGDDTEGSSVLISVSGKLSGTVSFDTTTDQVTSVNLLAVTEQLILAEFLTETITGSDLFSDDGSVYVDNTGWHFSFANDTVRWCRLSEQIFRFD